MTEFHLTDILGHQNYMLQEPLQGVKHIVGHWSFHLAAAIAMVFIHVHEIQNSEWMVDPKNGSKMYGRKMPVTYHPYDCVKNTSGTFVNHTNLALLKKRYAAHEA